MCLVVFSINHLQQYKLILAANRDEYYKRKSLSFDWYEFDHDTLLAPRDLEAFGSFFGITKKGKLAFLTNYRNPYLLKTDAPSRGLIVWDYLTKNIDEKKFIKNIQPEKFNPFNFVFGTIDELYYFSNINKKLLKIKNGIHTLSNSFIDANWPKTQKAKINFQNIISSTKNQNTLIDSLLEMLHDTTKFKDNLPNTGIDKAFEIELSSIFVKTQNYGTQYSYVLIIDNNNKAILTEENHMQKTKETFIFEIT
ncbi:MAG: NRDE family protein [Desulfurella sp.]|uniref:NRDE family protein n=1 Tax=Desulfurella sp. TaxID=1962857 RepID=UPI003D10453D